MTPLARAFRTMEATPDDTAARLAFFHEFAASEVHLPGGETPEVFETSDGPMILAFADEADLAAASKAPVERASLPGRALVAALEGTGLAVMLDTGAGETLLDIATLDWLRAQLADTPDTRDARLSDPEAPRDLAPELLEALDRAFGRMQGLARRAWLFQAGGGLVLALEDAPEAGHAALSRGIAEAVRFSQWDGTLDVTFTDARQAQQLKGRALRIDLPEAPARPERPKDQPPRLK